MGWGGVSHLLQVPVLTSGVAFSPTDIDGLQLWIDFSDITTLYQDSGKLTPVTSDGDVIGAAEDKSGQGNDVTQVTTGNKPTYKTGIKNELSVSRYDGSDDYLSEALLAFMQTNNSHTVFVVVAVTAHPADAVIIINGSGTSDRFCMRTETSAPARIGYAAYDGSNGPGESYAYDANFHVTAGVYEHTTPTVDGYNNGSDMTLASPATKTPSNRFDIGGTGATNSLSGDVCEIIGYDSALSDENRQSVETYLNNKWAVY